ncbi:DUF3519 domain-containing protein [Helicobacter pylori]|uniref:DUF3519 domain-containing protein n=1 Tax=Helicobacter pylori TaxID=210 RepID=UPI00357143A8
MMVLENACEFKEYLATMADEMGFYGSFEVVGKNINLNNIPNAISNGKLSKDDLGRLKIETKDILVALRDNWQGEPLKSKWVITGFEKKVGNIREQAKFIDPSLITKDGEHLASSLNSVEPNNTTKN